MAALRLASVALVNSSIVPRLRSSSAGNDVDEQLQRVGGQRGDDSWPAAPGTRTPAAVMWDTGFPGVADGFYAAADEIKYEFWQSAIPASDTWAVFY